MEISNGGNKPFAVITGASSGIGFELAKVFADEGYDTLVVAEDEGIDSAAQKISELNPNVISFRADLAGKEGAFDLYRKIEEIGRPVDVLAVNAGVGSGGEFAKTDLEKEVNLVDLNVLSAVVLTKLVLRDMLKRGQGKILFTSSVAAETPGPYEAVYAASKAFLQSFAMAVRHEVQDQGITVTALQPGATETNFFVRAGMLNTEVGQSEKAHPSDVARQGFDALMAGKDHVITGSVMNKIEVARAKLMSEKQGAKMQAKATKPTSLH